LDAPLPEAARAFVEGDVSLLPGALADVEIAQLVDYLVSEGDGARLQRLAEAADKRLAKPARRGLHLLRTRGHSLPEPEKREFRLRGPYAEESKPSGMVSFIDGHGERVVWLVNQATDGLHVYQIEISETHGIIGFQAGSVSRKDWRQHMEGVLADARRMVVAAPHEHVRFLVEEALQRTLAAGRTPPEEFAHARLDLGPVEPWQRPAIAPIEGRLQSLHERPEIAAWVPPEDMLHSLDLELGQIATSSLVVSPTDRAAQMAGVVDRLADSLTMEFRKLIAERLEETALMLVDPDERGRCIAAAQLTRDPSVSGSANPFLRQLLEKLIKKETP
jgi:hypothetical protein